MTKSIPIKALCAEILRLFNEKKVYDVLTTAVHTVTGDKSIVLSLRDRRVLTEMALAARGGYDHGPATYFFVPVDMTYNPTPEEHEQLCLHAKWAGHKREFLAALDMIGDNENITAEQILLLVYKAFMSGAMAENGIAMQLASTRQFGNERLANVMEQHNMELLGQFVNDCREEAALTKLQAILGAVFAEDEDDRPHSAAHKFH